MGWTSRELAFLMTENGQDEFKVYAMVEKRFSDLKAKGLVVTGNKRLCIRGGGWAVPCWPVE